MAIYLFMQNNRLKQLQDTINVLVKRVDKLELDAKRNSRSPENKTKRFKKGDRVRILTTALYGKKGDEAIVSKVGTSRYTVIIVKTGEIAVRDFKSIGKY